MSAPTMIFEFRIPFTRWRVRIERFDHWCDYCRGEEFLHDFEESTS